MVILGYSLGDTNLKAIISDYKGFSKTHVIGSNIFLISRSGVDWYVKDYYSHCYGIRVLDNLAQRSIDSIRKVVYKGHHFKEAYLKLEDSFYRIVSA